MPRLALVSPIAEACTAARLLRQHGYTIKVSAAMPADIVLPLKGGSLAFVVATGTAAVVPAMERAVQAAKAARRCTVLVVGTDGMPFETPDCPTGVSVLWCEDHAQACEWMLECVKKATDQRVAPPAEKLQGAKHAATERVSSLLSQLWGVNDAHAVDFLLAARPLAALARTTDERDWEHLCAVTVGLVDRDLLYTAIEWLQSDAVLHGL